MTSATAKERLAKGLCPQCGKEAAPYYLCHACRDLGALGRMLNRMAARGMVKSEKRGRYKYWSKGPNLHDRGESLAPCWLDLKPTDKRRLPRFRGIPLEIEQAVIACLTSIGRPASIDEIVAAWGKLRSQNRAGTIASNLVTIITAKDKMAAKLARRAARNKRQSEATA